MSQLHETLRISKSILQWLMSFESIQLESQRTGLAVNLRTAPNLFNWQKLRFWGEWVNGDCV